MARDAELSWTRDTQSGRCRPLCEMADEPPPAAAAAAAAPAAAAASDVVGFAYQPDMLLHRGPRNHHPEKPERLTAVLEVLQAGGLLDQCVRLPARSATDEELLRVHTAEHLKHVTAATQAVAESPDDRSLQEPHGVDAIYYHPSTEHAARTAAGCVLQATERVLSGECRTAFALVRPPGHHAEAEEAIGFCFYNSVARRSPTPDPEASLSLGPDPDPSPSPNRKREAGPEPGQVAVAAAEALESRRDPNPNPNPNLTLN